MTTAAPVPEADEPDPSDPSDQSLVDWWLYLLTSPAQRTYVGITTDLARRLAQHNGEAPGGAKSTRAGRPWTLARSWGPFDRSQASRHEYALKRLRGDRRSRWEPD